MNVIITETNRLLLKGYSPQDISEIFAQYPKDIIQKMLGHHSEQDYQTEAYKVKNGYSSYNRSFLLFLMMEKSSGTIIGRCGLHNWNMEDQRAEIGYAMGLEQYKQRGFMSEAVNAVLEHGFGPLKLNRIEALVGIRNIPSLKIMHKFNFTQEGVLKKHHFHAGQLEDAVLFAKLREDFLPEQQAGK